MAIYNPYDWYWFADTSHIFSSKSQTIVTSSDAGYLAAVDSGMVSQWPVDDNGEQTDEALQDVLDPYRTIFVNDVYYAANQRWKAETGGMTVTGIKSAPEGMPIKTDERSKNNITIAVASANGDSKFTTTWVAADGNEYVLTNAEIVSMGQQLTRHINACFMAYVGETAKLKKNKGKAKGGREEIDKAFEKVNGK